MKIYVRKAIEPGSPQSRFMPVILARNNVTERLQRILHRYTLGNVNGRSFLISGHRGAGKSTLVRKVVHDTANELTGRGFRPLLIVLPGPSLLPPEDTWRTGSLEATQAVLEQITLNLYRTLSRQYADSYAGCGAPPELATTFRLRLDGPVELAELRAFWSAVDAVNTGILFAHSNRPDQGLREIAALFSCLRAYLSIAARNYEETSARSESDKAAAERGVKTPADRGLISALLGAGGGSAVGAAMVGTGSDPVVAAFTAVATAIGSGLLFNYSSTRSLEASSGFASSLTLRRDAQSLARELPELIVRCHDAGLAPIFLVDELDKVDRLHTRMESLVRNIKFLITEQAMFFS